MEKKKQKRPDEGMGKFCIRVSYVMFALSSLPREDLLTRSQGAAVGFMALGWGLNEVANAKKWKQKHGESDLVYQMEIKKDRKSYIFPKTTLFILFGILAILLFFLVRYKQQTPP